MRNASGHNYRIGTVRSLWTWLWSRYHVRQNAFLVRINFRCRLSLTHSCGVNPRITIAKLKLETLFNRVVRSVFRYLKPFWRDSQVWQTNIQIHAAIHYVARSKMSHWCSGHICLTLSTSPTAAVAIVRQS